MPDDRRPDGLSRSSIHVWEDSPSSPAGIAPEPVTRSLDPELTARLDPESAARAYPEGHQDDALTSLGALTQRLSRTSGFLDARAASVASARSPLRTRPAAERETKVAAVATAFDAVGIA